MVAWGAENRLLDKMKKLGLPSLNGRTPAYYSPGYRQQAEKLQSAIDDINTFFKERLNVQTNIVLAVLDSKGWTAVTGSPLRHSER